MAQQHTNDISDIHSTRKQVKEARNNPMSDELEGYMLHIPENILNKIHDDIRNDEDRLRGHLVRAVKIGLLSIEGGEFTLSTEKIENVLNNTANQMTTKYGDFDTNFRSTLDQLILTKLTGDESVLAHRLNSTFGDNGQLQHQLDSIFDDISNPEKKKSVPNRVTAVMQEKFDGIETEVTRALDLADDGSPLSLFLKRQQNTIDALKTDVNKQMNDIRTALNVDEILQQKDDEIKELKDKSTHKGIYFENDTLEALTQIAAASKWKDEIIHTGANVVEGSLVKAGDILIQIDSPGNLTIAVEAKSGNKMGLTEISGEAKRGREARTADAGIGVMTRKARGATQGMLSNVNAGKDTIAVVDWTVGEENDDPSAWVALEVTYVTIRAKLIAEHLSTTKIIDADAINKQVDQIMTELKDFKNLKTKTTQAQTSVKAIEDVVENLESKLKASLEVLKNLTKV
jgi:ABC-type phosphate transport system auxiliary subunit